MKLLISFAFTLLASISNSQEFIKVIKRYNIEIPDSSKENSGLYISPIYIKDSHLYIAASHYFDEYNSNFFIDCNLISDELKYFKKNLPVLESFLFPSAVSIFEINDKIFIYNNPHLIPNLDEDTTRNIMLVSYINNDTLKTEISIQESYSAQGLAYNDSLIYFTSVKDELSYLNIYDVNNNLLNQINLNNVTPPIIYSYPAGGYPGFTNAYIRNSEILGNKLYFTSFEIINPNNPILNVNLYSYDNSTGVIDVLFSKNDSLFSSYFNKLYKHNNKVKFQYIKYNNLSQEILCELTIHENMLESKELYVLPDFSGLSYRKVIYMNPSMNLNNIHILRTLNSNDSIRIVNLSDQSNIKITKARSNYEISTDLPILVYDNKIVMASYHRIRYPDFTSDFVQKVQIFDSDFNELYTFIDTALSFKDELSLPCNKIIYGQYVIENDSLFLYGAISNLFCSQNIGINPNDGFRIVKYYIDINSILSSPNVIENKLVSIFPNPGNQSLTIQSKEFKGASQITVSNYLGQIIHQTKQNESNITIQANDWPAGIYFVKVKRNNTIQTLKWIKQ